MANNYFQFKQFTVRQEHCAMKVTTDACLFGAWVRERIGSRESEIGSKVVLENGNRETGIASKRILDIGTGTGLLALMLAQKEPNAQIDAVEIDAEAAKQALDNFNASQWKERLKVFNEDINRYEAAANYDFIITNPPFFNNDLKSVSNKRNLAMHSQALCLEDLLSSIKRLLKYDGKFAILLPSHRSIYFEGIALEAGFHLLEKVSVKQTPNHPSFRSMLLFGNESDTIFEKKIIIKAGITYTVQFAALLKDYYLYL